MEEAFTCILNKQHAFPLVLQLGTWNRVWCCQLSSLGSLCSLPLPDCSQQESVLLTPWSRPSIVCGLSWWLCALPTASLPLLILSWQAAWVLASLFCSQWLLVMQCSLLLLWPSPGLYTVSPWLPFSPPQRQIHLLLHETHQTSHLVWMLSVSPFISRWPIFLPLIFPQALSVWLLALIFYSKLQPVGTCIEKFPCSLSCIHVILNTVVAPTFPPQFKAHFCLVSRQSSTPSRLPCPPLLCHPVIVSVICPMSPMTATLGSVGLHHYFLHFSHSSVCPHFSNITSMSAHRSFRNILEASLWGCWTFWYKDE